MAHIKRLVIKGFKSFARETVMEMDQHMNVIVGPNGSGKSASYDTLVRLSTGEEIEIGKLVDDKILGSTDIKKLKDGIYVNGLDDLEIFSLNKFTGKIENKKISKYIKREGDVLYKIITRSGKEIKATGCHPVMTFKDQEIKSVLIRDLDKGSMIASPRIINIDGRKSDNDFSRLIGYIIGDGYISRQRIEFVNNDKEIIEDYKNILRKYNIDYSQRLDKNITRIYTKNPEFYKKIKSLFIDIKEHPGSVTSSIKKIPSSLMSTDNESISNIIAGLYDTDGSIRKDIAVIELCTKNKELAHQLQGLLLRFGIISKIKKRICSAKNTKDQIKRDYYYVYITGIENIRLFNKNIDLKVNSKKQLLNSWVSKNLIENPNTDLLPKELNIYIKELSNLLGIKYKPLRKQYPSLASYIEYRCNPSRKSLSKILSLFQEKYSFLNQELKEIKSDHITLIDCMKSLNISGQSASKEIGLSGPIILRDWQTNTYTPRQENLTKFYNLIKETFEIRFNRINELLNILKVMAYSDIYWDEIVSIERLEKPEFVYDLTIDNNHNFIANNIFIHNSNVTDALCFVLGRLSIKSMRAAKASHLIFSGNKQYKGANEAYVEITFDNTDKAFALDNNEIVIRRIVKKNGQGTYKINDEVKTRQEILELLAQAGIDPHGFNIVLQGEIEKFVKMPPDERRKVIEEVAGISVYEMRKEKSLKELEKTEEKLKQINAILRERTNYLKNLENEREEALKYRKLEDTIKKCKASIINKNILEKDKELNDILKKVELKRKDIEKIESRIVKYKDEILLLTEKADTITRTIQQSSGLEQDTLFSEISLLKQEIAAFTARKENFENQLLELDRRRNSLEYSISQAEDEITGMSKEKGKDTKKELDEKKKKLEELDDLKRQSYLLKSNLSSLVTQLEDKKRQVQRLKTDSSYILVQIESTEKEIRVKESLNDNKEISLQLRSSIEKQKSEISSLESELLDHERVLAVQKGTITDAEKIISQVSKLDICPLCKTKITQEHIHEVVNNSNETINKSKDLIKSSEDNITRIKQNLLELKDDIAKKSIEINIREIATVKLQGINEKKQQLRRNEELLTSVESELKNLEQKKFSIEEKFSTIKISEEQYENLKLEVNELQRSEERNVGIEISTKQRELERIRLAIKQNLRDKEDFVEQLKEIKENLLTKTKIVEEKEKQAEVLKHKYQKMFEEKNSLQDKVRALETTMMTEQNEKRIIEIEINNFMITKAQYSGRKDTLMQELKEFEGIELLSMSLEALKEKLTTSEQTLARIGSVNMRALEVYDEIKSEYDKIKEKVTQLETEKAEIIKIIEQIDRKKKRVFLLTLEKINELFSRNFSELSVKGVVTLEPINKKEVFEDGLDIIVKVGGGKYFDVTSLSGGEQTLVALSLIFSIQEYKPYCFYIFDEIDAALDRRNSEKLAQLLKRHMKDGQYLIITHNDSIISESSKVLYGISMQEGISKVLSLEV